MNTEETNREIESIHASIDPNLTGFVKSKTPASDFYDDLLVAMEQDKKDRMRMMIVLKSIACICVGFCIVYWGIGSFI